MTTAHLLWISGFSKAGTAYPSVFITDDLGSVTTERLFLRERSLKQKT